MKPSTTVHITEDHALGIQEHDCDKCSTYTLTRRGHGILTLEEMQALTHTVTKIMLQHQQRKRTP